MNNIHTWSHGQPKEGTDKERNTHTVSKRHVVQFCDLHPYFSSDQCTCKVYLSTTADIIVAPWIVLRFHSVTRDPRVE